MVNLRALLIGISHYGENDVCFSLKGAVADVEAMATYLIDQQVPAEKICKLTSSNSAEGPPPEPRDEWPTYENMVAAIQQLTTVAEPGEHVLIYYSGHGGRVKPSLIPGSKTVDEGLIPPDVGAPGARYLRDVELTYLLHRMAEKGLKVTLIIDACHSAGVFRSVGPVARGSRQVDEKTEAPDSLVASAEELKAVWQRVHNQKVVAIRGTAPRGWSAAAQGSVLLAACRSNESAYELSIGGKYRGVLTYCLLEILAETSRELSFEQIRQQLISRIRRYPLTQTPVLEGDLSRSVFGGRLRSLLAAIEVRDVDQGGGRVRLGAGQAVGLAEGALLRVLPGATSEGRQDPRRRPVVKITEVGPSESWGIVIGDRGAAAVQIDDRATLIDPGDRFRRRVVLIPPQRGHQPEDAATTTAQSTPGGPRRVLRDGGWHRRAAAGAAGMIDAVRRQLERRASGFLELVDEADSASADPPDFQVSIQQEGDAAEAGSSHPRQLEIRHADGSEIADLPRLPVTDPRTAGRIADSLVQLARFHNVRDLENRDESSPLKGALTVELGLLPEGFAPGHDVEPRPFPSQDSIPEVEIGRTICLTVTNLSQQALEINVLDLQPGWTIEQIHRGTELLEGETRIHLPFDIYLPSGFRNRREVFKVFATVEPTDFRSLQLPAIGKPRVSAPTTRGTRSDPLARLFAEISQHGPKTRSLETRFASRLWTSAQVEFEVVRPGSAESHRPQ